MAGTVVELGIGTGRIAVPDRRLGRTGDQGGLLRGMLAVRAPRAAAAGVAALLDLRLGYLADPPVSEHVQLVTCPFRSLLHMDNDEDRRDALAAAYTAAPPGRALRLRRLRAEHARTSRRHTAAGSSASPASGSAPTGTWSGARCASPCGAPSDATRWSSLALARRSGARCSSEAGFEVEALYGWFDRRPYEGGEDSVWIARRPRFRVALVTLDHRRDRDRRPARAG